MKKTVTTILSLAMAIIMVSSLASGVILAKGDDDHDNRRKNKNKYKTVTMHDVVILECVLPGSGMASTVNAFFGSDTIMLPADTSCTANLAFLLDEKFRLETVWTFFEFSAIFERHTLSRTIKMRVPKDDNHEGDDN